MSRQASRRTSERVSLHDRAPAATLGAVQPILRVPDIQAAATVYMQLGFTPMVAMDVTGRKRSGRTPMSFGGSIIHLATATREAGHGVGTAAPTRPAAETGHPSDVELLVVVDDLESLRQACEANGFALLQLPREQPWGGRSMRVRDPFGYLWDFWEPARARPALSTA